MIRQILRHMRIGFTPLTYLAYVATLAGFYLYLLTMPPSFVPTVQNTVTTTR